MNCPECQDALQRQLDGAPGIPDEALDRHVAQCATCRERFAAAAQLLAGLRSRPRPAPSPGLTPRIVAAALRDRQRRRTRVRRGLYLTFALAASILLMFLASAFFDGGKPRNPDQREPIAQDDAAGKEAPVPRVKPDDAGPQAAPNKRDRSDDGRNNLAALTGRLADKTIDQAKVLWTTANPVERMPIADMPKVPELDPLDPAAQPLRQATEEANASLHAVGQSARRAFDYFTRELPVLDMPHDPDLK